MFRKNPLFLCFFVLIMPFAPSVATEVRLEGNLYSNWVRLAVSGKEQAEIEYYFRNHEASSLEKVKERLRLTIIQRLKYLRLGALLQNSLDLDDINTTTRIAITEIRYMGMEEDMILRYRIKEEFGINLSLDDTNIQF